MPSKSDLGFNIAKSQIGIVWHTSYSDSFENMQASFSKNIASKLNPSKDVWSVDAEYKDQTAQQL